MVMSPDNVLAMGTYNKHIGLYDAGSGQQIQLLDSVHQGGVTSLKFMPNNSNQLVSAARKCELIKVKSTFFRLLLNSVELWLIFFQFSVGICVQ